MEASTGSDLWDDFTGEKKGSERSILISPDAPEPPALNPKGLRLRISMGMLVISNRAGLPTVTR